MEFHRLHTGIKRLRSKAAFTLVETMVAFALIGIVALFTASGLVAALGIYNSANDLRKACGNAVTQLYEAAQNEDEVSVYKPNSPKVGVVMRTDEFTPEKLRDNKIDVYEICASRGSKVKDSRGIVLYFYKAPSYGGEE